MKVAVLGGGWYGCHIASSLMSEHEVTLFEKEGRLFAGASGNIPARLHLGAPHYPRSGRTRAACRAHYREFITQYGFLISKVEENFYAIAEHDSLIDFKAYRDVFECDEVGYKLAAPAWLEHIEGALQVDERHVSCDDARSYFTSLLADHTVLNSANHHERSYFDRIIDCTFCSGSPVGVARYEPCITVLLEAPRGLESRAITIMDGPFPSLYPWDQDRGLVSLTSAKFTPLAAMQSYQGAQAVLRSYSLRSIELRISAMRDQIEYYYPAAADYKLADYRLSIRAQPRSGSDMRVVEVWPDSAGSDLIRVRAGKIDAVIEAERQVRGYLK